MKIVMKLTIGVMLVVAALNIIHFKAHYDSKMAAKEKAAAIKPIDCDEDTRFQACYIRANLECERDMDNFSACFGILSDCSTKSELDVVRFRDCFNLSRIED